MKLTKNKQTTTIVRTLLFSTGIMLSCNVFAAPKATQAALDTEINNRIAGDAAEAAAREAADAALQGNIDTNTTNISANSSAINAIDASIDTNSGIIGANTTAIGNNTDDITTLLEELGHLQDYIAGIPYEVGDTGPSGGIVFYISDGGYMVWKPRLRMKAFVQHGGVMV